MVVRVKNLDVYSTHLLADLLADSRGLTGGDIDYDFGAGYVFNYESSFSRATRIDLANGTYYHTSPFYDKEKFVFELEVLT